MMKEYVFAGFGGQGMLLIGKFLAMANMLDGKHVSWLPSYGPEMRGGTANCSVVVSDEPVGSPLIDNCDVLIAMNLPSLDKSCCLLRRGGDCRFRQEPEGCQRRHSGCHDGCRYRSRIR